MSTHDKHSLAIKLLASINEEWSHESKDADVWQEEHVVEYDSTLSFDELVAEVQSIEFRV